VRKSIARVLTVYRSNIRTSLKSKVAEDAANKKGRSLTPLDLRTKKTRALRRALTKAQLKATTEKAKKKAAAFPTRKYALKA
jgi:large subunit ribosomal protein L35e